MEVINYTCLLMMNIIQQGFIATLENVNKQILENLLKDGGGGVQIHEKREIHIPYGSLYAIWISLFSWICTPPPPSYK
eukprot:177618-Prorocentrum_minimum.AAC.1